MKKEHKKRCNQPSNYKINAMHATKTSVDSSSNMCIQIYIYKHLKNIELVMADFLQFTQFIIVHSRPDC